MLRVFIDEEPYAAKDLMKESAASADQGERVESKKQMILKDMSGMQEEGRLVGPRVQMVETGLKFESVTQAISQEIETGLKFGSVPQVPSQEKVRGGNQGGQVCDQVDLILFEDKDATNARVSLVECCLVDSLYSLYPRNEAAVPENERLMGVKTLKEEEQNTEREVVTGVVDDDEAKAVADAAGAARDGIMKGDLTMSVMTRGEDEQERETRISKLKKKTECEN